MKVVSPHHCPWNKHATVDAHCNDPQLKRWGYCEVVNNTCGGDDNLNNCWRRNGNGYDVYQVTKHVFRKSPMCPALKQLSEDECMPACDAHAAYGHLPQCNSEDLCIGDLCEADTYSCGTSNHVNNCHGYDVYRVVDMPLF